MTGDKIAGLTRTSTPLCQDRSLLKSIPMRLSLFSGISGALALSLLAVCSLSAQPAGDERSELAIVVGEVSGGNPTVVAGGALNVDAGVAFEANYARKFRDMGAVAVYWEINGMASPLRYMAGIPATAAHSIHSGFVMPGIKLQFTPKEVVSPWLDAGAGYAFYNSSGSAIQGGPTGGGTASTGGSASTYAIDFGGGADFALGKRYLIRGEVRGIYTGNPNFGVPTSGGLFNFVIGGGLVWRF